MDLYTKLHILTAVLAGLFIVLMVFVSLWFCAEKKLAKYGESKLYTPKKK